jgi:hypothetical protein
MLIFFSTVYYLSKLKKFDNRKLADLKGGGGLKVEDVRGFSEGEPPPQ